MSLITALFDSQKARDRFWENIVIPANPHERENECWVWCGSMEGGKQPRYHRYVKRTLDPGRAMSKSRTVTLSPGRVAYILYHRQKDPNFDLKDDVDIARHKFCTMMRECMNPNHMFTRFNGKLSKAGGTYEWRFGK